MKGYKEIGGIHFNMSAVKKMSYKEFRENYVGKLKKEPIEDVWFKLTGKKAPKK